MVLASFPGAWAELELEPRGGLSGSWSWEGGQGGWGGRPSQGEALESLLMVLASFPGAWAEGSCEGRGEAEGSLGGLELEGGGHGAEGPS